MVEARYAHLERLIIEDKSYEAIKKGIKLVIKNKRMSHPKLKVAGFSETMSTKTTVSIICACSGQLKSVRT